MQGFQFSPVLFKVFGDNAVYVTGYGCPLPSRHAYDPLDGFMVLAADLHRLLCCSFRPAPVEVLARIGFFLSLASENVDVQFHDYFLLS